MFGYFRIRDLGWYTYVCNLDWIRIYIYHIYILSNSKENNEIEKEFVNFFYSLQVYAPFI